MLPSPNETGGSRPLIVLGNPENRRVQLFSAAVAQSQRYRLKVVAWLDFLADPQTLASHLEPDAIVRVESPGENFAVERALLLLGAEENPGDCHAHLSCGEVERLEFEHGRMLPSRQWYLGWQAALRRVQHTVDHVPGCRTMNLPAEIAVMFDKAGCHDLFRKRGVPVPGLLGLPQSYEDLRTLMHEAKCRRIFLKPCHSSSASGVVAFETSARAEQAFSSVELVRRDGQLHLFNSLKIRRYSDPREICELIDAVCRERSIAERWLPKAGLAGRRFDLRTLVIAGQSAHTVVRQSAGPMTNLHLGNQRGELPRLREQMPDSAWQEAMQVCEAAAAAFPHSLYVAVDLLVAPSLSRFAVAEVNAFGDLLPNLLHDGRDSYATELAALDSGLRGHKFPPEGQVSTIG